MNPPAGALLPLALLTDEFAEHLRQQGSRPNDLFRSIANHEKLLEAWSDYVFSVRFDCATPRALRELVIVRVADTIGAEFVRFHHLRQARAAGVTEAQLAALHSWADSDCFDARERACLALTDAYLSQAGTDPALGAVADQLSPAERVEMLLTASQYQMICHVVMFLGVAVPAGELAG